MIPPGDNYTVIALDPVTKSALGFLVATVEAYTPPLEEPPESTGQAPPS